MTPRPPPGQDQRLSGIEIHPVAAEPAPGDAAEPDDKITSLFELGGSLIEQPPPPPVAEAAGSASADARGHCMRSGLGLLPRASPADEFFTRLSSDEPRRRRRTRMSRQLTSAGRVTETVHALRWTRIVSSLSDSCYRPACERRRCVCVGISLPGNTSICNAARRKKIGCKMSLQFCNRACFELSSCVPFPYQAK